MSSDHSASIQAILVVHAACGALALLASAVALATAKGSRPHVLAGRTFAAAMLVGLALAVPAIAARANVLLGLVGAFSAWLVLRGARAFRVQRHGPTAFDRALVWVPRLAGAGLVGSSAPSIANTGSLTGFGAVALGLGLVALWLSSGDAPPTDRAAATRAHLSGMLGATIAATTAFLAVNGAGLGLPEIVLWLGPTAVGTPAIIWWSRGVR
jgi:hypothetical protein